MMGSRPLISVVVVAAIVTAVGQDALGDERGLLENIIDALETCPTASIHYVAAAGRG